MEKPLSIDIFKKIYTFMKPTAGLQYLSDITNFETSASINFTVIASLNHDDSNCWKFQEVETSTFGQSKKLKWLL